MKNQRTSKQTNLTYKDMDVKQLSKLAASGWSVQEVADFYNMPATLLSGWIVTNKNDIGDAFNSGVDHSVKRVEKALFERAIGYKHKETKVMMRPIGGNQGSEVTKIKIWKHYPPEVQACIFYLTNKRRDIWKHRFELQTFTDTDNLPDMSQLKYNELKELAYGTGVPIHKKKNKKKILKEVKEVKKLSSKKKIKKLIKLDKKKKNKK